MTRRTVAYFAVVGVVAGGLGFWGGTAYQKSKASSLKGMPAGLKFSQGEQGNRVFGQFRTGGSGTRMMQAGGVVAGEIIAKDEKSVTVKLPDGGSKIVFYSASTEIGKAATTTPDYLNAGQTIVASGTANADGSVNAQNIQVRPEAGIYPQK